MNQYCERQNFFRRHQFRRFDGGSGLTSLGEFFVHVAVVNKCLHLASENFVFAIYFAMYSESKLSLATGLAS